MKRDDEIKRLIYYAKSLGVKVTIRDFAFEEQGEIADDPHVIININKKHHSSKTELILTLLHELSHARYINSHDGKISKAWILEDEREPGKKLPKKLRKEIADFELNSLDMMMDIAAELKIEIPMSKIAKQCELDKWAYSFYLDTGEWPTGKQKKTKEKELKEKYNV